MHVNRAMIASLQDTSSDLQLFAILSVTLVVTGGLLKGSVIKFFDALLPLNDVSNEGAWWRNFYQVSGPALLHVQPLCVPAIVTEAAYVHSSPNLQPAATGQHGMTRCLSLDCDGPGRAAAVRGELPACDGPAGGAGVQPGDRLHRAGVLRPHPGARRAGATPLAQQSDGSTIIAPAPNLLLTTLMLWSARCRTAVLASWHGRRAALRSRGIWQG